MEITGTASSGTGGPLHLWKISGSLQYLLIDGRFCGASVGHFRYSPYDLNDIVCSLPDPESRREEILTAVLAVNPGGNPLRFMGREI